LFGKATNKHIVRWCENQKISQMTGMVKILLKNPKTFFKKPEPFRVVSYAAGGLRSPDLQISQSYERIIAFLNPMSLAP
jgi:hypothetical protein